MSFVADAAEHAAHHVMGTAAHTRASFVDLGAQALRFINNIQAAEVRGVDSVLGRVGLQRRESALRPLLWFVAGAAAAGAIVFIVAPTQGRKIRERIREAIENRTGKRPATNGSGTVASEEQPAASGQPH
jgi:hypothetical protein